MADSQVGWHIFCLDDKGLLGGTKFLQKGKKELITSLIFLKERHLQFEGFAVVKMGIGPFGTQ